MLKLGTKHFTSMSASRPAQIKKHFQDIMFPPLTTTEDDFEKFLLSLDKDIPDSIYCFYCKSLHSPAATKLPSYSTEGEENNLPCSVAARGILF